MHPKNDPHNQIFCHYSLVFFGELDLFLQIGKNRVLPTQSYRDLHLWPFFRWGYRSWSNHPKEKPHRVFYRVAFGYMKMRLHQMFLKLFVHNTTSHLLCKDLHKQTLAKCFFLLGWSAGVSQVGTKNDWQISRGQFFLPIIRWPVLLPNASRFFRHFHVCAGTMDPRPLPKAWGVVVSDLFLMAWKTTESSHFV